MPMSDSIAIVSSICSEVTSSEGSTAFSSSIGDIAALLGGLDHLLDGSVGKVEQRAIGGLRCGLLLILGFSGFGCHSCYSEAQFAIVSDALSLERGARCTRSAPTLGARLHEKRLTGAPLIVN